MKEAELRILTQAVIDLSRRVGKFLKEEINKLQVKDVKEKGLHNLVTYVDKSAERILVNELQDMLPQAGFIAEEGTSKKTGEDYNWIIDPLDGTTNYIHKVPLYSVSIALKYHNEIILGVIYEPNLNECFYSWKGAPSYLNTLVIEVSQTQKVNDSLFATGFPYYDYDLLKEYMKFFEYLMIHSRGIRRLGTAAIDLAYVACGRYDGFFEYGLSPWDVAAGTLIVQNAGGKCYDFNGSDDFIFGRELVSVNPYISKEFMHQISIHFNK